MAKAAVAGHICLDIIPRFAEGLCDLGALLAPGSLTEIGEAVVATGGAVANTGQALHRLGEEVVLMAKIGDDEFGQTVRRILDQAGSGLADGLIIDADSSTSYSLVINPPGFDRIFLHSPGANHTFCAEDIDDAELDGCSLFHFGYPPLMRSMYERSGEELKTIFTRMKQRGITTSLDMTFVDPASESGKVDWQAFLKNVLPVTDIFLPSLDEILFMIDREEYSRLVANFGDHIIRGVDATLVERTAQQIIDLGVPVVVIKLGEHGLYLRTAATVPGRDASWNNVSRFESRFAVNQAGTTGAGDCAIAGFLSSYINGTSAEDAIITAVATGSASTESLDAVSAIPHRSQIQARINAGWARIPGKFSRADQ
jgi:sugar/nucleoside kinase (ribokinase family)